MPTFRKSEVLISAENEIELPFQLPALESEAELKALDIHLRECGIFLIIKKHPLQSGWSLDEGAYTNIRYVTEEMLQKSGIQLYELCLLYTSFLTSPLRRHSISCFLPEWINRCLLYTSRCV